jgi:hypothetical protein
MNAETRSGAAPHLTVNAGSENCLPVGTRLSDFEITGVLGEGGFGIVYLAYDHALQRTVAIKEYMPGALVMRAAGTGIALRAERHQETFKLGLKSFINEARLLARFDHPALVKVYRFWEQNDTAYTAMQFYDGCTIKDIVTSSPELIDEAWCRKMLDQIMQALETLYTMRILHRDVSPDNIIVQPNGDAVLLDFGSARQIIGDVTSGLTVILKPGYAPVEQYAGDASFEQGQFTDVYALSAVMYFAITKTAPAASIGRMISDPMVPLAVRAPAGYSAALLAAIDKGLAVLPQDRPQTMNEFRSLLGIASPNTARAAAVPRASVPPSAPAPAPAASAVPPAEPVPAQPAVPAPNRRLVAGAGAACLLALAAAGLYMLMPAQPRPQPAQAPAPAGTSGAAVASAPSAPSAARAVTAPAPEAAPDDAAAVAKPSSPEAPHAAPAGANYRLRIKPWGTLFVDGEQRGASPPLKQVVLTHGRHDIRIVNPSFPEYVTTIDVNQNKPGVIAHDFSAVRPDTANTPP